MITWVQDLDAVRGLAGAWAWPVRLDGRQASRALAASPASTCDLADAAGLQSPQAGARRLLRRRLLRALVARAQGRAVDQVRVSRADDGAPQAEGAYVSLAARGDWALLAVGPRPLGVDLELMTADPPPDFGASTEAPWAVWTAREAYAKAAGISLDAALATEVLSVTADRVDLRDGARRITAARFDRAEVVCAAVVLPL